MLRIPRRSISRRVRRQIESLWLPEQCPERCPGQVAPKLDIRRSGPDQRPGVSFEENPVCRIPWRLCCAAFDRETTRDRELPLVSPTRMAEYLSARSESSDAWRVPCPEKKLRRGAVGQHRRPYRPRLARAISGSPCASKQTFPRVRELAKRFGARRKNIRGRIGFQP